MVGGGVEDLRKETEEGDNHGGRDEADVEKYDRNEDRRDFGCAVLESVASTASGCSASGTALVDLPNKAYVEDDQQE